MKKCTRTIVILAVLAMAASLLVATVSFAQTKNPVKADKASIAAGKVTFTKMCVVCHGKEGKGNGPAGKNLKPPASDLTEKEDVHEGKKETHTDAVIFGHIANGIKGTGMVGYKGKISDKDIWNLVNFIKSIQKHHAH